MVKNVNKTKEEKVAAEKRRTDRLAVAANSKSKTSGEFRSTKTRTERLTIVLKQMLDRLIRESSAGYIQAVNWNDAESTKHRKLALQNIKDLLVIVKQVRELIVEVSASELDKSSGKQMARKTEKLLQDARLSLKSVGSKVTVA